ncbi:MAG TPA: alpha/beta hydrolase [Nocardioides sp.]|nr:alpha/beta hydrolase [Nocardioides sp.]
MSTSRKVLSVAGGIAAGAAGLAAAGTAYLISRRRQVIGRRGAGDDTPFGSLRSDPITVVTEDGVDLHVEIDEYAGPKGPKGRRAKQAPELTVVFVHGYSLSLDSWHFQRAAYRDRVRTVFYDQRSHGRSGRSTPGHATIERLGHDLKTVLDTVAPQGPLVLVGHSMGGMTIIALAEEHPDLFGDRVVGVGLISTTAGALEVHRLLMPGLPSYVGGQLAQRLVAALARGHRTVDGLRRIGRSLALIATDDLAFGDDVPASYVDFVDKMLAATPFEVVAEFFPNFASLDKFETVKALSVVPTAIICGTRDKLTPIDHSRRLHEHITGSVLLECEGAGHMVIMERHDEVNEDLDRLFAAAGDQADKTG